MMKATPDSDRPLPILGVRPVDLPDTALVVGDPARAARLAQRIGARQLAHVREYATYVGEHGGNPVAIVSHGVGAAGAGIAFDELCRGGVQRIIRAGTTGGMQPDVVASDLVVATAAVRDDGFTDRLVPLSYPAVASASVVHDLVAGCGERGLGAHVGVVLTSAAFSPMDVLGSPLEMWQRAGVLAVEMECAALFVVASQYGVECGAILAVDGNPLAEGDTAMSDYDPAARLSQETVDAMVDIALGALHRD